jgi:hypothetical protein
MFPFPAAFAWLSLPELQLSKAIAPTATIANLTTSLLLLLGRYLPTVVDHLDDS